MSDDLLTTEEKNDEGDLKGFIIKGLLAALGLFTVIVALILIVTPSDTAVHQVAVLRDILVIFIGLELFLIVLSLGLLILQITRLVDLLQTEAKPILQDTKETLKTAKGTVNFVSQNVARPLIRVTAFLVGLKTFLRELGGIRRAIRKNPESKPSDEK
jgi:hypothetical protein